MTEGISALSGTSELSLINAVFDKSKEKDDEKSGDIFDLLFQAIDDSIAQTQEQNNAINPIKESQKSDFNFGPPANIKIENLTYDTETSMTETAEQPSGKPSGGGSKNSDEEDETYSSMDLNQDGTVSTEEMLSYYGASESYGSSNTKASNDAFEQLLDLII